MTFRYAHTRAAVMVSLPALLLGLLLAGCSSTPAEQHYYLLRGETPSKTRDLQPSSRFAMGQLVVAPYVDQSGLILEVGPGKIRPARNHQWAEPMAGALRNLMLLEVSRAVGADVFPEAMSDAPLTFNVRIDQLHGTMGGDALLVAYWWIDSAGEELTTYQFSETRALAQDGYPALADAQKALLKELAERIGESLLAADAGG